MIDAVMGILWAFILTAVCTACFMVALARNNTVLRVVTFLAMAASTLYMLGKVSILVLTIICDLIELALTAIG